VAFTRHSFADKALGQIKTGYSGIRRVLSNKGPYCSRRGSKVISISLYPFLA
jgi:hypothetical protein